MNEVKEYEFCPACGNSEGESLRLQKVVSAQEEEIHQLMTKLQQLQGNFSHFHICNHRDDACALCGLLVENEVHLRSR